MEQEQFGMKIFYVKLKDVKIIGPDVLKMNVVSLRRVILKRSISNQVQILTLFKIIIHYQLKLVLFLVYIFKRQCCKNRAYQSSDWGSIRCGCGSQKRQPYIWSVGKFYPFDENLCWNTHMHKFLSMSVAIYSLKDFILFVIMLGILRIN